MLSRTSLILLMVACTTITHQAHAAEERIMVWTTDTDDNLKDMFLIGEIVRIHAYSLSLPYTIEVWTSTDSGSTWSWIKNVTVMTKSYVGDHEDIAELGRMYELRLFYESTQYATSTHFVISELICGTVMAVLASFGSLIVLKKKN